MLDGGFIALESVYVLNMVIFYWFYFLFYEHFAELLSWKSSCIAYNLSIIHLRRLMWEKVSVIGPTTPLIITMPKQTRLTGFLSPVASSTWAYSQSLPYVQVSPAPASTSQPVADSGSPLPNLPTRAGHKSKKTVRAEKKENGNAKKGNTRKIENKFIWKYY